MRAPTLIDLLRKRHRAPQTRIVALQCEARARRSRVVQLAEELVAHATVEQLVVYPYAAQLLELEGLSLEVEGSLEALLAVIGGRKRIGFPGGARPIVQWSVAFERHADGDEVDLLPRLDSVGSPEHLARMADSIQEFERRVVSAYGDGPCSWPEGTGGPAARSRGMN